MTLSAGDRAAIEDLSTRYCKLAEQQDVNGLLELFTEDAYFEAPLAAWALHGERLPDMYLRVVGREQFLKFFSDPGDAMDEHGRFAKREKIEDDAVSVLHIPTAHSIIHADAESATMVCYLTFHYLQDPPQLMAYGRYVDRLVKLGGEWKIADRIVAIEWDGRIGEPGDVTAHRHSEYPWARPDGTAVSLAPEDHTAILELAARYCHTVDYRDWDGLLKLFTDDLHFGTHLNSWLVHRERLPGLRLALFGHEEIRGFFSSAAAASVGSASVGHRVSNHTIEGSSDAATAVCDFSVHDERDPSRMLASGRYRDQLAKVDGRWKIAHRYVDNR